VVGARGDQEPAGGAAGKLIRVAGLARLAPATTIATMAKVAFDPQKENWHPSVLPGQIVLVTTVDARGIPNIAPKSRVTLAAFEGPVVGFGCTEEHLTLRNVEATGEFVINLPSERLAERIWELIRHAGEERIRAAGLTLARAHTVSPPVVEECPAHLECTLVQVTRFGAEAFVFGRVEAAAIDEECLEGTSEEQYFRLRPLFFLEGGTYGSIDAAKHVGRPWPTEQQLFLIEIGPDRGGTLEDHAVFLQRLRENGRLLVAGLYERGDDEPSGMYVLSAESAVEAEELACDDPLVRAGATFTIRHWTRRF
jgi:flavin reductase (DIM6/NTAB) family NADH-FMN oxidoreductase RutF/uncharacterized protein YciI